MAALLDVNALIALVDPNHVAHLEMESWFSQRASAGWATCAITENGMVRVLSAPSYPNGPFSPATAIQVLRQLKAEYQSTHEFWADSISIADEEAFSSILIAGYRQITDLYLLGLAVRNRGMLVSFDQSIAFHAVRGASASHVENPNRIKPH
jgi:uncharacterized protein